MILCLDHDDVGDGDVLDLLDVLEATFHLAEIVVEVDGFENIAAFR